MTRSEQLAAMRDFYRDLDAELAGREHACDACGRCCRFDEADHILYASALERLYLAHAAAMPEHPDAPPDLLAAGLRCPFQHHNLCLAREGRTLGCRLHFCREEAGERAELWHERLKRLHEALGVAWDYAPLLPIPNRLPS